MWQIKESQKEDFPCKISFRYNGVVKAQRHKSLVCLQYHYAKIGRSEVLLLF